MTTGFRKTSERKWFYMTYSIADPHQHYCCCGALREATRTHCKKCRDRSRWYRRKAWRINPERRIDPAATTPKEEVTNQ
jgi:hypothetical protein